MNRKDEVYPYVEVDVDSLILHPDFDPETLYNDIALIHMTRPIDPNFPHVAPACLPKRGTVYEDEKCWVSGWGKDFFGKLVIYFLDTIYWLIYYFLWECKMKYKILHM